VELWNVLNRTAVPQGGTGYNTNYGWGVVNAWNAINALNKPFISVNSFPHAVSRGSTFSIGWSIIGPTGLAVTDTHVVFGPDAASLNSSSPAQTGLTGEDFSTASIAMPQTGSGLAFKIVAKVNGTDYESPLQTIAASNLPDFLFVLYQFLSSNLLYLALFILVLAAIVAFVPQRRARARRTALYRQQTAYPPTYRYAAPPPGPPPGPPAAAPPPTASVQAAATPPPIEFVKPAPPPAPVAAPKKRCANCGTLVNAENMFCFYCGAPFR
jgi:hypothetical protein